MDALRSRESSGVGHHGGLGHHRAAALDPGILYSTVCEGSCRYIVAWVKDMSVKIARWTRTCWVRIRRYLHAHDELYDQSKVALSLNTGMGTGRGNRGPPVWMQYVDPSPGTMCQEKCYRYS